MRLPWPAWVPARPLRFCPPIYLHQRLCLFGLATRLDVYIVAHLTLPILQLPPVTAPLSYSAFLRFRRTLYRQSVLRISKVLSPCSLFWHRFLWHPPVQAQI